VNEDDAAQVRSCLDGNTEAMRAFVARFQSSIFGLCFRMLGHRQDAEDVVQEVFVRAFRSLHQWDPERTLKPWLLTIAANRCRTFLSKRARRPLILSSLSQQNGYRISARNYRMPSACYAMTIAHVLYYFIRKI